MSQDGREGRARPGPAGSAPPAELGAPPHGRDLQPHTCSRGSYSACTHPSCPWNSFNNPKSFETRIIF